MYRSAEHRHIFHKWMLFLPSYKSETHHGQVSVPQFPFKPLGFFFYSPGFMDV